jgi:hypothetical protein
VKLSGETRCTMCGARHCRCVHPRMLAELWEFELTLEGGVISTASRIPESRLDAEALDADVPTDAFATSDVVEIAWLAEGSHGGPPWIAIVRLADGRWLYASQATELPNTRTWTYRFAATRDRLWWACTDDDRERFTPSMSRAELDEELVALDAMLDSGDADTVALAERRMRQRRDGVH